MNEMKSIKKKHSKEIEDIVDNLSLMDDELMAKVFDENIPATTLLISTILNKDVIIERTKGQFDMKNPVVGGRCISLDVYAEEKNGNRFDCEVQRSNSGASPKRVRFHSAMLDSRMLKSGQNFDEIHDSYVIFITEKDYYGEGKPFYYVDRKVSTGKDFEDGNHIIYVNGAYNGDDDIGLLLSDMRNKSLDGFNHQELEEGVKQFKVYDEGRQYMSEAVEKFAKKYAEEYAEQREKDAEERSKLQSLREIMKNLKLSAEQALDALGIPKAEHQKYINML